MFCWEPEWHKHHRVHSSALLKRAVPIPYRARGVLECTLKQTVPVPNRSGSKGFQSQDFRISCPKIHIWGELCVQFLFILLHYTQTILILGCPKSAEECPKDRHLDTPLAKGLLEACHYWPLLDVVQSVPKRTVLVPRWLPECKPIRTMPHWYATCHIQESGAKHIPTA